MAWTSPRTWVPGEKVLASLLNAHLRDNLLHLKEPPTAAVKSTTAYTTTSTSFVDINAALEASIVTTGGRLLIVAHLYAPGTTFPASARYLLDGVAITDALQPSNLFVYWTDVLPAGTHTIKPQWTVSTGTVTMSFYNILVREVS